MVSYIVRRLLIAVPTLLGVVSISFVLVRVVPGDPARIAAGPDATAEDVARIREQLGLDDPLWHQFVSYVGGVLHGDLGTSSRTGRPVLEEIVARIPNTMILAVGALVIAALVGCTLGVVAALRRGRTADVVLSGISVLGVSMPVYWSGLLLMIVFAVNLGWLPAAGTGGIANFVLPMVTLAIFAMGFISRQMRSSMVEAMSSDYIRTARARGASRSTIVLRHGLRNAALPVVTIIGLELGGMLGGAVVTETVFAWPGLGRLIVDSIGARDFSAVQGTVLVFAGFLVVVNLATDLVYAYVDPRIRYE
jgi:ABC-type dipeptide/oligopeptide/nickel transport system permease component